MNVMLNILWFLHGGIIVFFEYVIAGILLMIIIIGIPFDIQAFKLVFRLFPHSGKRSEAPLKPVDVSMFS